MSSIRVAIIAALAAAALAAAPAQAQDVPTVGPVGQYIPEPVLKPLQQAVITGFWLYEDTKKVVVEFACYDVIGFSQGTCVT
jgi:hypothetical protein